MLENLPVLLLKKLVVLPYQEVKLELNIENGSLVGATTHRSLVNKILERCCNKMQKVFKGAENTYEIIKFESWEI